MHQVKIFTGIEGETARLSKDINDWLRQSKVKVVNVFGNIAPQSAMEKTDPGRLMGSEASARRFAPSDVLLVVVYEE